MAERFGATPDDWLHFDAVLGLTADLLPVVSNPSAVISQASKLKQLGKTPSRYNREHEVMGIGSWTQHKATHIDISRWAREPDYGICVQTRNVRAIDVDIEDVYNALAVLNEIQQHFSTSFPRRSRSNSNKFLIPFFLKGDYAKRIIRLPDQEAGGGIRPAGKVQAGIIEFLATGQQFIAAGTHPSGVRYTWDGGNEPPASIPELDSDTFEQLWRALELRFASTGSGTTHTATKRHEQLNEAIQADPIAKHLYDTGVVISAERDGRLHITCPFAGEHTNDSAESATTYFPARTGGYERGHFVCLHAHCAERTDAEFTTALGIVPGADDFDVLPDEVPDQRTEPVPTKSFTREWWDESLDAPIPEYLVKGILPDADLIVLFGEPGSGKTFIALDIACAIARGLPWREKRVKQGDVCYIAAEDADGVRNRIRAYVKHYDITKREDMPLHVIAGVPNLLKVDDVKALIAGINEGGHRFKLVIVDTLAQVTAGANENSGEDMGLALAACRAVRRATGAAVLLVHHSGKDATKGARGHSSLRGACDAELEVTRYNEARTLRVSKMKNAEDNAMYGFELNVVQLGVDADGDAITSCVVQPSKLTASDARKADKDESRGPFETLIINKYGDLHGLAAGDTGEVGYEALVDGVVDELTAANDGTPERRRDRAKAGITRLIGKGIFQKSGSHVSLVDIE